MDVVLELTSLINMHQHLDNSRVNQLMRFTVSYTVTCTCEADPMGI